MEVQRSTKEEQTATVLLDLTRLRLRLRRRRRRRMWRRMWRRK